MNPVPTGTSPYGQPALEHVALGDPNGAAFGTQGGEDAVEDAGEKLVEVEGGAELQTDRVKQTQTLDLMGHISRGGRRSVQNVGHVTSMGDMAPLRK
jgi:hypothetical protein